MPPELRGPGWQKQRQRGIGRIFLALLLFVVAAALLYVAWQNRSQLANLLAPVEAQADGVVAASQTPARPEVTSTPLFTGFLPVPTTAPTRTPTNTPTITPSPTPTHTATPTPTPTATITPTIALSTTLSVSSTTTALIVVERANIRTGPGPDYGVVGVATRNQQFAIIGRTSAGDWWQVCCLADNQRGWLFGELVTPLGDVSTVPVVLAPPPEATKAPITP